MKFQSQACALLLFLSACGQEGENWTAQPKSPADATAEAGYLAPPEVVSAKAEGNAVRLAGTAAPRARVRIAPPRAEPILAQANAAGRWGALLMSSQPVHLFGLSMTDGERSAQAEGYMMMAQDGTVAQLRAGAGAVLLAPVSDSPRILAIDYDREGGAVVSGVARPAAMLGLRVDRAARGETKADAKGRFSISLTEPLAMGAHEVEVSGDGGTQVKQVAITPAGDIGAGPFVGRRTEFGWQVDWMPPGGGLQTTLIFP